MVGSELRRNYADGYMGVGGRPPFIPFGDLDFPGWRFCSLKLAESLHSQSGDHAGSRKTLPVIAVSPVDLDIVET
jgi:hypothetical protein